MTDRIARTEPRPEGFYWVALGQNLPEIANWERGEWWLTGDPRPWRPEAASSRWLPCPAAAHLRRVIAAARCGDRRGIGET